jgi:hypothetical protein
MNLKRVTACFLPQEGDLKPLVEETLGLIDALHRVADVSRLPIVYTDDEARFGQYVPGDGRPERIELSRSGPYPRLSLTHEIGHLIDHTLGGYMIYSSSQPASPLSEVVQAVSQSAAIQDFRDFAERNDRHSPLVRQIVYWLDPIEQWARAYAQYVATRSGHPIMLAELQLARDMQAQAINKNVQWERSDFEPVAAAIEAAFQRLGWRG